MSLGKKKESYTITESRRVAPASPLELALRNKMNTVAGSQADALEAALRQQQAWEASPTYAALNRIQELSNQNLINRLSGTSPVISPEMRGYIEQAYAAPQQQALNDMRTMFSADAARRGMTILDTPAAAPYQQNVQQYLSNVASSKAGDILKFGQADADFNKALADFADRTRLNTQKMRLDLSTANTPGYQFSLGQEQNRINAAPTTRSYAGTSSMPTGQLLFGNQGLIPALAGPTEKFMTKGVPWLANKAFPAVSNTAGGIWSSIFGPKTSPTGGLNFNTSNWNYM